MTFSHIADVISVFHASLTARQHRAYLHLGSQHYGQASQQFIQTLHSCDVQLSEITPVVTLTSCRGDLHDSRVLSDACIPGAR